jgi:hypothetical protein
MVAYAAVCLRTGMRPYCTTFLISGYHCWDQLLSALSRFGIIFRHDATRSVWAKDGPSTRQGQSALMPNILSYADSNRDSSLAKIALEHHGLLQCCCARAVPVPALEHSTIAEPAYDFRYREPASKLLTGGFWVGS